MSKSNLFSAKLSREFPDRPAIVGDGAICTYEEMHSAIEGLCKKLKDMGVKRGSKVALWSYNCSNWIIAFFAIVRAGGVAVLINYSTAVPDVSELLKMSETEFILCGDNGETKKKPDALEKLAALAGIPMERCLDIRQSAISLKDAYKGGDGAEDIRTEEEADETALIIFTSGTTSMPKAVQITQKALSFDADAFNKNIAENAGRNICVAVPLFHILGLLMSYSYLCRGATICLPSDYKPETLAREIEAYRVSDMAAVGAVYIGLAEIPDFEERIAPCIHLCMIAGGMSTPVQMMRLELWFSNATFINMYGQSEAAPLTMVHPKDLVEKRAQTVGRAIDGLEIRISDGKGGFLPQGEIGEVVARGDNLMKGYLNLPEDKQPFDKDGWLLTGDLGYFDEDNFLHLSGRIKDVIIRGGENISPSEIENALNQLDYVREAKVMGAPHPIYGESVEACVTLTEDSEFNEEEIKSKLREMIPRFKVPSHIFLYDSFPLNVNGKLDQRMLKADMLNRIKRLQIDAELGGGVTVFDIALKNSSYSIVPLSSLINELASGLGYSRKRGMQIRLAIEEMLTERITDAYAATGDIRVKIILMPEWLRVEFSDDGAEYFVDKRLDTSMSAKIILMAVNDFHTDYADGKPLYCMDFLYEQEINIKDFLLKSMA